MPPGLGVPGFPAMPLNPFCTGSSFQGFWFPANSQPLRTWSTHPALLRDSVSYALTPTPCQFSEASVSNDCVPSSFPVSSAVS